MFRRQKVEKKVVVGGVLSAAILAMAGVVIGTKLWQRRGF